ncbi:MAG: hypothetical protein AAF253_10860 [Pseudomonadota bacterium]
MRIGTGGPKRRANPGLGFGGGYYYESERTGRFSGASNQLFLGDIQLVDASVWYTIAAPELFGRDDGTIHFQLAAKNIFDEAYYLNGFNPLRIPLGTPRSVFGSVSFDF